MSAAIADFRLDAVHTYQVRTLRTLGFRTRVTLSNGSDARPDLATDYRIDVSVRGLSTTRQVEGVGVLTPGEKLSLDCTRFTEGVDEEVVIIFRLIPLRLAAKDGKVTISREELGFLVSVKDHYVEYHRDDGFAAGVLYQTPPFNYDKWSRDGTTLIQAPKCYVSRQVQSFLSLMNTSPDPTYAKVASLKCSLRDAGGRTTSWVESIRPFEPALVDLRARAGGAEGDGLTFYCFYGVCENAALVPLTIHRDEPTGAIGIEHSLPPTYYGQGVVGPRRAQVVKHLAGSPLFRGGA